VKCGTLIATTLPWCLVIEPIYVFTKGKGWHPTGAKIVLTREDCKDWIDIDGFNFPGVCRDWDIQNRTRLEVGDIIPYADGWVKIVHNIVGDIAYVYDTCGGGWEPGDVLVNKTWYGVARQP
jgi:hypothetical protein